MPGQSAASDGAHKFKATLSPILSPRAAPVPVSSRGTWCAKCQSRAHWTFECFQKSERACLQEQLSCAIAACETRQVALRQRQEDVAAQRDLHAVEMQIARNEQATLAARVEELEQHLIGVLKDESRLIDQTDKLRSELNDARNSLKACTARCEQMHQEILAAHEDKARAVASATEAAAQRAVIAAQQADARIAQAKADADAETQRCLRDSAKRFAQDIADSQMQVNEYAKRIEALQESLAEKRRELKSMEKQLADAQSKLKDTQDKITERATSRKEIKAKIKKIEDSLADQNKAMEIEEMRLRNEKAVISHEKKPLTQLESQLSNEHYRSDLDLKSLKLKPKECPTCKKPWDKGPSDSDIEKATGKVTESVGKLKEIRSKIEEVNLREEAKQAEIDEQQKRQRQLNVKDQVRGFSSELDALDKLDNKAASECTNLSVQIALLNKGPSDVSVVKAQGILDSKNASLVEYEDKVAVTTLELEENKQLCQVVEYWSGAFNSSGIPNMVLSRSVDPLNQVSMALSHRMSGGTLGISYETTKELSSGAEKNCLNIRVKNSRGASRVTGNSKGESGLTNLIVAETITEVGRVSSRIGFRWYDEVVNSQDPKVRRCILSYLKETAQRLGILIFVVDHHPEVSNYADHVLRATKSKEGVTTFSWV